jgi:hypothetical protein
MKSNTLSEKDLRQVYWRFLTTVNLIQQEKQFYPSLGTWCGNCDFVSICPSKSEVKLSSGNSSDQLEFWDNARDDQG